jgi:hypothetical protein
MNTSHKHRRLIGGLLLICSVGSLLLYLQARYLPPPSANDQVLAMYERFTGGVAERTYFWHFSRSFVPAVLALTAALAVWNFRLSRRQP